MRLGLRRHFCFPRPALRLLILFPSFSLISWDGVGQQRVLPSECVTVTSSLWFFHVFFCERISTSLADYAPRIDCGPTLSQRVLLRNSLWLSNHQFRFHDFHASFFMCIHCLPHQKAAMIFSLQSGLILPCSTSS